MISPSEFKLPVLPDSRSNTIAKLMLGEIWQAVDGRPTALNQVSIHGRGALASAFPVSELAAASVAAAGLAVSELIDATGYPMPKVRVDRRLASFWFSSSLKGEGWSPPSPWDPIAGDYECSDGWIRLHTNAPAHRRAALSVLAATADKQAVAAAVRSWKGEALETTIVANGGCAAFMRSTLEWTSHAQGMAVASEPIVSASATELSSPLRQELDANRPLAGFRVLDLTRVLAGPVATRFLAGFGAQVLRIDPPDWDEPGVIPEVMLGKQTARLDLRTSEGHDRFLALLSEADVLVHGYRPGALDHLGLGLEIRNAMRPGLIDVALDAYGWSGPWRNRRGFDSLVQMSAGIADAGMRFWSRDRPTPLPVQALDHATGYIMAAAAILGLVRRVRNGRGSSARASLARTAGLLGAYQLPENQGAFEAVRLDDYSPSIEATDWGPARRLLSPIVVGDIPLAWDRPAMAIGHDKATWRSTGQAAL